MLAFRIGQRGEEMEKVAGQDRDFQHAHEGAIMDEPLTYREERLRTEARLVDLTVIGPVIAAEMSAKKVTVGKALAGRWLDP